MTKNGKGGGWSISLLIWTTLIAPIIVGLIVEFLKSSSDNNTFERMALAVESTAFNPFVFVPALVAVGVLLGWSARDWKVSKDEQRAMSGIPNIYSEMAIQSRMEETLYKLQRILKDAMHEIYKSQAIRDLQAEAPAIESFLLTLSKSNFVVPFTVINTLKEADGLARYLHNLIPFVDEHYEDALSRSSGLAAAAKKYSETQSEY